MDEVPTRVMLEEHARELRREKLRLEELLDRTERLLAAVERGLEMPPARMSTATVSPVLPAIASPVPAHAPGTDSDEARYRAMGQSVAVALPRRVDAEGEPHVLKTPVWVASSGGSANGREVESVESSGA